MHTGISLTQLASEIERQVGARQDYLVNTQQQLRLVAMPDFRNGLALVTLGMGDAHLERWEISDHAHDQIAGWLDVPTKFYGRLLKDHRDMVIDTVNKLFEREPGTRMIRTLDGKCRAFLSDRYRRIDNDQILHAALPVILGGGEAGQRSHKVIRSTITDDQMSLTVVYTDPALAQDLGPVVADGSKRDIVQPGFRISNSEVGKGRLALKGFFHRGYCDNGCVWGAQEFEIARNHIGGKLTADLERLIISDEARKADDRALILMVRDMIAGMGTQRVAQAMGDSLRAMKSSEKMVKPAAAIELLAKSKSLFESEKESLLANLIAEADLTRFGALNAITAIANDEKTSTDRALELEEIGGSLITMTQAEWSRIARAEKVAVAA